MTKKLRNTANRLAELHQLRFENMQASERRFSRTLASQAVIHAKELVEVAVLNQKLHDALVKAIGLVNAAKRNEWTPACGTELEQLRKIAKGENG